MKHEQLTLFKNTLFAGDVRTALKMTEELLELAPKHDRAIGNKKYYEKELAKEFMKPDKQLRGDDGSQDLEGDQVTASDIVMMKWLLNVSFPFQVGQTPQITPYANPYVYETEERRLYEMLCRNEISQTPQQIAQLKCKYVTNKSAFLKIGPLKLEEASLKPYIVVYHEVMFDSEIEFFKQLARPRVSLIPHDSTPSTLFTSQIKLLLVSNFCLISALQFRRATVQNHKTGALEVAHYRISKSAWLKDEEHQYIRNIAKRVEDMTGLTATTSEELQVVNYGIGGHYEPHFDFARREEKNAFQSLGTGNRIATVLFYVCVVVMITFIAVLYISPWHAMMASPRGSYFSLYIIHTGALWVMRCRLSFSLSILCRWAMLRKVVPPCFQPFAPHCGPRRAPPHSGWIYMHRVKVTT